MHTIKIPSHTPNGQTQVGGSHHSPISDFFLFYSLTLVRRQLVEWRDTKISEDSSRIYENSSLKNLPISCGQKQREDCWWSKLLDPQCFLKAALLHTHSSIPLMCACKRADSGERPVALTTLHQLTTTLFCHYFRRPPSIIAHVAANTTNVDTQHHSTTSLADCGMA